MVAPAGPCEWCGGQQSWTIIAGQMYVSCNAGCQALPLEGLAPPHDSDLVKLKITMKELSEVGGVYPVRGDAAKESQDDDLPF